MAFVKRSMPPLLLLAAISHKIMADTTPLIPGPHIAKETGYSSEIVRDTTPLIPGSHVPMETGDFSGVTSYAEFNGHLWGKGDSKPETGGHNRLLEITGFYQGESEEKKTATHGGSHNVATTARGF